MSTPRQVTWEQFERSVKFAAGLTWGTLELWMWGGRPYPLAFIGTVWGLTEAGRLYGKLRQYGRQQQEEEKTP